MMPLATFLAGVAAGFVACLLCLAYVALRAGFSPLPASTEREP